MSGHKKTPTRIELTFPNYTYRRDKKGRLKYRTGRINDPSRTVYRIDELTAEKDNSLRGHKKEQNGGVGSWTEIVMTGRGSVLNRTQNSEDFYK